MAGTAAGDLRIHSIPRLRYDRVQIHGEACRQFETAAELSQRYLSYVTRSGYEQPEIGWVYQSGGGLARLLRHAKSSPLPSYDDRLVDTLAELCQPLSAGLAARLKPDEKVAVTHCSSSSGLSSLIAHILREQLSRLEVDSDFLEAPSKDATQVQAKSIADWNHRKQAPGRRAKSVSSLGRAVTAVVVDDVLASGWTFHSRARQLNATRIIPASLTADLPGFIAREAGLSNRNGFRTDDATGP